MPKLRLRRNKLSFSEMSNRLPASPDPLAFLSLGRSGVDRDAYDQIHGAMHSVLTESERSMSAIFERLRPEGEISDRMVMEANSDLRTELARSTQLADMKRGELTAEISRRLEALFIQSLIVTPDQDPPVRRWANMADRVVRRDLPPVSEPAPADLDVPAGERTKRLTRWQAEADEWLGTLALNTASEVVAGFLEEMNDYTNSWLDTISQLRRLSNSGGRLYQEVQDAECWAFDSDDPTVKNLLNGTQAQDISRRILNRFQLSNSDVQEVSQMVSESLNGRPVYGLNRIDPHDLCEVIAAATARKIRQNVSLDDGFLSLVSNGARFGEELGELLVDMHMGAAAMEEKMWRVGEVRVGHVDSAAGVGITTSALHRFVARGLGGGRKFAAIEGHPVDNHRFDVQMSTVGAPLSDLAIFRDMVNAWYAWHFEERRGENNDRSQWMEAVQKESWKLYPDIGDETGVRAAIVELIDEDIRKVWNSRDDIASRLAYGQFDDSDGALSKRMSNGHRRAPVGAAE